MLKKRLNKKGFTLAELLIVVAIIAVLVAIAIPVFTQQMEKSKQATDLANFRSVYAEATTELLTEGGTGGQKTSTSKWQSAKWDKIGNDVIIGGKQVNTLGNKTVGNAVTVTIDASGNVTGY